MSSPFETKNIVLLNQDLVVRLVLKKLIHRFFTNKVKVYTSSDGVQGLGFIFVLKANVVIVDTRLPEHNGMTIVDFIKTNERLREDKTKIIVIGKGENNGKYSSDYQYVDYENEEFPLNLIAQLETDLNEYKIKDRRVILNFFIRRLGKKAIRYAKISNSIIDHQLELKKTSLIARCKWLFYQSMTSIFVSMLYILEGETKDENQTQEEYDIAATNRRTLPTIVLSMTTAILIGTQVISVIGILFATLFLGTVRVQAVAKTWDGGGTDGTCGGVAGDGNKWSCAANWNPDGVPAAADTITFNATSTKAAVIDAGFQGTVGSLTIASGYGAGTITVSRTFTVSGAFSQADGSFNGSNQTMSVGSFALSGGNFTSTSTNMNILGDLTITGAPVFSANSGTITITGNPVVATGYQTLSCNNVLFNKVVISKGDGSSFAYNVTVNSDCDLPLGANPTIVTNSSTSTNPSTIGNFILNGKISGTGTLTISNPRGGNVTLNSTAQITGFSGYVSTLGLNVAGMTADFSAYSTFSINSTVLGTLTLSSGSLSLPSTYTLNVIQAFTVSGGTFSGGGGNISSGAFSFSSGTFTAPSGNLTVTGVNITGGTFSNGSGTVILSGGASVTTENIVLACNNVVFNKFTITKTNGFASIYNITVGSTCTLPLGANPTIMLNPDTQTSSRGNLILNGKISGTGTLTINSTRGGNLTLNTSAEINGFSGYSSSVGINVAGMAADFSSYTPFTITNAGYDSAITVSSGSLLMPSATYNVSLAAGVTVSGGTFHGGGGNITALTAFALSGGTFTAPSGNLSVFSINITNSPVFNHGSGTITISGGNNANDSVVLNCNNAVFNKIAISRGTFTAYAHTVTVNSNCDLPLGNNPTIVVNAASTNTSTRGNLTIDGRISGTGTLTINNPAGGTVTFNTNAQVAGFTGFVSNGLISIAGNNLDLSSYSTATLTGGTNLNGISISSGSLKLPSTATVNYSQNLTITGGTFNVGSINMTFGSFSQSSGTFNGGSGSLTLASNFTLSGGNYTSTSGNLSFSGNMAISGTPVFAHGSGTITLTSSATQTLGCNNVTFNKIVINKNMSNGSLTIPTDCSFPLGNNPTIITANAGSNTLILNGSLSGTGTLTFGSANSNTFSLGSTASFTGFSGLVTYALSTAISLDLSSYTTLSITGNYTQSAGTVSFPAVATLNIANFALSAGIFNGSSGNTNVSGNFTISAGTTYNANGGTLTLTGGTATLSCNNANLNRVVFNKGGSGLTTTVGSNCTLPLGDNPTVILGTTGLLNVLNSSGAITGTGTLTMSSNSATVTLNAGATITGFTGFTTPQTLTIAGAAADFSGFTSLFNVSNTLNVSSGSITLPTGANITTLSVTGGTINATTGNWTVTGAFTMATGTVNAPSGNLNIGGNFTHTSGTFTHNNGTVVLNGTNQSVLGAATTFNNLTKIVPSASAQTLTFVANTTQTVAGTLRLNGFNNTNRLLLRSSVASTQWRVDSQGARNLSYLDIKDTYNTNASIIAIGNTGSIDNGNNAGFDFAETNPVGWWKFDDASGQVALDSSDKGNNGTLGASASVASDDPAWTVGCLLNGCLNFDGTSDYVKIPVISAGPLALTQAISVSVWANPDVAANMIVFKESTGAGGDWWFSFSSGSWGCFTNGGVGTINTGVTAQTNTWTLLTLTYTPSLLSCYVNGELKGTDNTPGTLLGNTNPIIVAGYPSTPSTFFDGKVDDVRVYNRALLTSEVSDIYTAGLGLPITSSLGPSNLVDGSILISSQPNFTFSIAGATNVKHQIQISTVSNFSSTVIDYTSALGATGANSFTVGQLAGSGTYTVGSSGQTLAPGDYYWRVRGINDTAQAGPYVTARSGSIAFTKADVPGAPTSLSGIVGDGQAILSWTAPVSNGNSAITDYYVEYKLSADSDWSTFNDGVTSTTGATVTGLVNGGNYDFRVKTVNAVGPSVPSNTAAILINLTPNAPSSLGPLNVISATVVPTLRPAFTFTLADPNGSDTVKYQIQIDDNSDYSSPVVDYTSALVAQGSKTFTVGQAAGSGSYTVGSLNQSLTTGSYYWRVKAIDNNTFESSYTLANGGLVAFIIDSEAPAAFTPTLNVVSPTTNKNPTVTFSTTDNVAVNYYQLKIDGGSFTTRTSPYVISETLGAGDHTITVRAYDTTGNYTDGSVNFTLVINAPAPFTPTLNTSSVTNNAAPILSFSTTDLAGIDYYEVKVDGGSFSTQTSPYQLPTLAQGNHSVTVRAHNINADTTDGTLNFTIDLTAPFAFTPTLNVGAYTNNVTPILSFLAIDTQGVDHYEVQIDSGSFTTQTSPYTLPALTEGFHTFNVKAVDGAGNVRNSSVTTTIDLTAPADFTPTADVTSPTSNTRPTITFATTDNNSLNRYELKVDSGSFTTQTSPYQLPALSSGDHTVTVRAYDSAGNFKDGEVINITLDESGPNAFTPTLNVVSPTNNVNPFVNFSTTDNIAIDRYELKLDSGSFSIEESPYSFSDLTEGSHVITIRAFDTANNYTDGVVNLIIDLTSPSAFTPTLNRASPMSDQRPIVSFSTSDNQGVNHYAVKIDSGSFSTHSSGYQVPTLAQGSHTITVRAYDSAGNYRDGSVLSIIVDITSPASFTPTLNVTSPTINTSPIISFATTDNVGVAYYRVKVDGGLFSNQTSPYQIPSLSNGDHTFTVRAYDGAGNYSEASVNLNIDRSTPDPFTPTINTSNPSNTTTPILSFSTVDNRLGIDHYEVKIDNGTFTTRTSPYQLPALSQTAFNQPGHTITVRAYNSLGSTTDGTLILYIDTSEPTISANVPTLIKNVDITDTTLNIVDNLLISMDSISATGGTLDCKQNSLFSVSCDTIITSSGTFEITATDTAGNVKVLTLPNYIIESTVPEITISAPTKSSATTITNTTVTVTDNAQVLVNNVSAVSGGTIICSQTSQTRVDCTASISDSGDLVINASDSAGNADSLTESGYVVSTTPPEPFIPSLNTTSTTNNTAPILYFATSDTDGIDHYEVKIDNGSFTTQVSPYQLPTQTAGFKTITIRAYDALGNFRDASINITINTSVPNAFTPTLNVTSPTNNARPILSFSTTDINGIDHYEVKVDSGSFSTQTSPYTLPSLTEGAHTITVTAYNTVGNTRNGTVDILVDLTAPASFTPMVEPGEITNVTSPELTYSTTDNIEVSHYVVEIDNGSFGSQTSPYMTPTLPEGEHTVTVIAFDTAGNSTDEQIGLTVDNSPPVINYIAPTKLKNSNITDTTFVITDETEIQAASVTATGGTVSCTQFSIKEVNCTSIVSGSGTLSVSATDSAGTSSTVNIANYIIETVPPVITINAPTKSAGNTIIDTTINITDNFLISASHISSTGGVISCLQTSQTEINCTASISDSGDLVITAFDEAGNVTQAMENDYVVINGAPGVFVARLNTGAFTNNTKPILLFETTDPSGINHYEVKIDNNDFATQTSPYQLPELTEGFHTMIARAFSNDGNFRDSSVSVTVDITNPTDLKLNLNIEKLTNNQTPTVTFFAEDNFGIGHYEIKVESAPSEFKTATSPYVTPALESGDHKVTIKAVDKAGNFAEIAQEFKVDALAPSGSITINNGANETLLTEVVLTIKAEDNSAKVTGMSVSNNENFDDSSFEPYAETKNWILEGSFGNKIVYVKFKDEAGNISQTYSDNIHFVSEACFGGLCEIGGSIPVLPTNPLEYALPVTLIIATLGTIVVDVITYPKLLAYGIFLIKLRKKSKTWGIVYDQETMQPIPFTTVRIYSAADNKFIAQKVTDLKGKYGFVINKGKYYLEVINSDYKTYKEEFDFKMEEGFVEKDIALSKTNKSSTNTKKKLKERLFVLNQFLVYTGFVVSLLALLITKNALNFIVVLLYILQFSVLFILQRRKKNEWGYVYNSHTKARLNGAFVRIYDAKDFKQNDVMITDNRGRYVFNLKEGAYLISVHAPGFTFPSKEFVGDKFFSPTGQVFIKLKVKKGKAINLVIPLDPI